MSTFTVNRDPLTLFLLDGIETLSSYLIQTKTGTIEAPVADTVTSAAQSIANLRNCLNVLHGRTSAVAVSDQAAALRDISLLAIDLGLITKTYGTATPDNYVATVATAIKNTNYKLPLVYTT